MEIKTKLSEIVGSDYVADSEEKLEGYSKDYSLMPARMPNYVVWPENTDEISKIVKFANELTIPVLPSSSGVHFYGATIPKQGGIVLDLRRMNKISDIDERNRKVRIEPGVTWGQLQTELAKHHLMALIPFLPHPQKSVLTSHLEREPMIIPKYEYSEPLLTLEVVFPSGDIFRTGSACVLTSDKDAMTDLVQPEGPGLDFFRLLQGAQGTMGVVTWANVKVEYLPQVNHVFFLPFDRFEDAVTPLYRIQKRMIGEECFLINRLNLALILREKGTDNFKQLMEILPPWTLILVLAGGRKRPQEKIEYEEEALREIGRELGLIDIWTALPGVPGAEQKMLTRLHKGWPTKEVYWKLGCKGSCQDLFFITTLDKVPGFIEAIEEISTSYDYLPIDIGFYIQPLERGRACHFECNFYYNPAVPGDVDRIGSLYMEAAELSMDLGAFFTRPYGPLADLVYSRATSYTTALRKIKQLFDPRNVMSPGNLSF